MIRHIEKTDYKKFIKLLNLNINKDVFDLFISNLNCNRHIIVIYEEDNEILGTGSLLIEAKLTYNISYMGHIENIFVNENNRNKGIGKIIVNYLIGCAKDKGCYRIDLACDDKLKTYYKELGFNKQLVCMSMLIEENFKHVNI
jgi:glucosamine-phosphate N-acetyltransferase